MTQLHQPFGLFALNAGSATDDQGRTEAPPADAQAQAAKREAIARVGHNAGPSLMSRMLMAVEHVAQIRAEFTTDAVREVCRRWGLDGEMHEPRALGALMTTAAKQGICERTDRTTPSADATCHGRDKRVWRSLMHNTQKGAA